MYAVYLEIMASGKFGEPIEGAAERERVFAACALARWDFANNKPPKSRADFDRTIREMLAD